jgi:hypothetical protein
VVGACTKYRICNKAHTKLGSRRGGKRVWKISTDKCKVTPMPTMKANREMGM